MQFREELWKSVADVYRAIIGHGFIRGLSDGSLPLGIFQEYVVQDTLYLSQFSRAVAVTATKAPSDEIAVPLLSSARDMLLIERVRLHEFLLSEWRIGSESISSRRMNQANLGYTNYMMRTVIERPFHEALGAVLPCFWIYGEVGKELLKKGSTDPTYKRWIDTYASEDYGKAVERVIIMTEKEAARLTDGQRSDVMGRFRLSAVYEYLFWDTVYREERWPFEPGTGAR